MAPKAKKRTRPGPPARYGYRPTLTIRLTEPVYERIKAAAAEQGKSLSEAIEDRLGLIDDLKTAERQLAEMRASTINLHGLAASLLADATAARSAAHVQAIRAAGLMLLREIEGRPTRVIVDLNLLLNEASSLRSGFVASEEPTRDEPRPMTDEEAQAALQEIRSVLDAAVEQTRAVKGPSDDEAA